MVEMAHNTTKVGVVVYTILCALQHQEIKATMTEMPDTSTIITTRPPPNIKKLVGGVVEALSSQKPLLENERKTHDGREWLYSMVVGETIIGLEMGYDDIGNFDLHVFIM